MPAIRITQNVWASGTVCLFCRNRIGASARHVCCTSSRARTERCEAELQYASSCSLNQKHNIDELQLVSMLCFQLDSDECTGPCSCRQEGKMVHQSITAGISICLKCADAESVVIGSECITRCQLIQSLPSLPDAIVVPFSSHEVSTWIAYSNDIRPSGDIGFFDCMSILVVADFLQDQDMVDVAAKAANACLLQPSRQQIIATPCSTDLLKHAVSALQSLPAHLSQAVVRSGGQLQDWMRVLPPSCLPIMVPAAVDSGTLSLDPDHHDSNVLDLMLAAAKPLATISSLEVSFSESLEGSTVAANAVDTISSMTQLRSLSLIDIAPPEIPGPLTALTHLSLDCSDATNRRAKLQTDISVFMALQELAMVDVPISDFTVFSNQLQCLTALTCLELCWAAAYRCQATITAHMSESLAQGLAALTALKSLSLGVPQTLKESNTGGHLHIETVHPQLHSSIIRVLPSLSNLTSLSSAGRAYCEVDPMELEAVCPHMTALKQLTIQSSRVLYDGMCSLKHLPALEHFHHERPPSGYNSCVHSDTTGTNPDVGFFVAERLASWLPTTLTSLHIDWMMPVLPDLADLPHLQSIKLNGCLHWCNGVQTPTISALTNLKTLHTGPPVEDEKLYYRMCHPDHYYHTPELDFAQFVACLPVTLCDLRMPGQQSMFLSASPFLGRLTNLTSLDIGDMAFDDDSLPFEGPVMDLQDLHALCVRCDSTFLSEECCWVN